MAAVCTRHRAMGRTTARAAAEPTVPFTWSGIGYGEARTAIESMPKLPVRKRDE